MDQNPPTPGQPSGKIRHTPAIGERSQPQAKPSDELSSIGLADSDDSAAPKPIRALGMKRRHEDEWSRTPNTTGEGAIHVKTFHCKVTEDGMVYMDQQINEWLDAHPQYEVKLVQTSIGTFTGKIKEPHVICQVWV